SERVVRKPGVLRRGMMMASSRDKTGATAPESRDWAAAETIGASASSAQATRRMRLILNGRLAERPGDINVRFQGPANAKRPATRGVRVANCSESPFSAE